MLFNEKFSGKNISRRTILSHTNKQNDKGQTIPIPILSIKKKIKKIFILVKYF